ncbi:hypothetical protein F5I97DRAFT_1937358 [Phlebopus sp. FC_14]|nr:hypothetical protein F5I97DRAFT_1937358 [Phlebopus sp. FC_14]
MDKAKFKATLSNRTPYCRGTCTVPALSFFLFYNNGDGVASQIDLSKANSAQLKSLTCACQLATFGLEGRDVLDETYRKAARPSVTLISARHVEFELYKLNVYEKEGFRWAHKDTPRGEKMFGSLVIVFPTAHGGELIRRHEEHEWVIGSTEEFKQATELSVGYITFSSDIEHEVAPVRSGCRSVSKSLPKPPTQQRLFAASLIELHNCFGLQRECLIKLEAPSSKLKSFLKEPDTVLARPCDWFVKVYYNVPPYHMIMDKAPEYDSDYIEDVVSWMIDEDRAEEPDKGADVEGSQETDGAADSPESDVNSDVYERDRVVGLIAVIRLTSVPGISMQYIAYGNNSGLDHIYGHLCLVIRLDAADKRKKLQACSSQGAMVTYSDVSSVHRKAYSMRN